MDLMDVLEKLEDSHLEKLTDLERAVCQGSYVRLHNDIDNIYKVTRAYASLGEDRRLIENLELEKQSEGTVRTLTIPITLSCLNENSKNCIDKVQSAPLLMTTWEREE